MAIHVSDEETEAAVRRLAALTGEMLTEAIRRAVEEWLAALQAKQSAVREERTAALETARLPDREERFRRMMETARAHQNRPPDPHYVALSHNELTDAICDEEGDL